MTATAPAASAAATSGWPSAPISPAIPPPSPSIEKVRTPATRSPGFCSLSFQPRSMPISRPQASAAPTASAWPIQSGEPCGMPAQMIGHEGRDEVITVIVAGLHPQGQRNARIGASPFEQLGPKFFLDERVVGANVDQQTVDPRPIRDQRAGIVPAPGALVVPELMAQRLLAPRHL